MHVLVMARKVVDMQRRGRRLGATTIRAKLEDCWKHIIKCMDMNVVTCVLSEGISGLGGV